MQKIWSKRASKYRFLFFLFAIEVVDKKCSYLMVPILIDNFFQQNFIAKTSEMQLEDPI